MKKTNKILLYLLAIAMLLIGCSGQKPESVKAASAPIVETVDVDLSKLSSTMAYAEVSQIMFVPDNYIGKTIKMRGDYTAYYDELTKTTYYSVIATDETACCVQGLEFKWLGDHSYPDEYPVEGAEIEIVGEYKSYNENGQVYYYIETSDIKII